MNKPLHVHLLLFIWVGLMASSFVVSETLQPFANPIASTGLRFLLASDFMLPFIVKFYSLSMSRALFARYLFASLFLVLFFVGLFESLKTTTALRTSVIYTLLPLLTVFFSFIKMRVKASGRQLAGFILGSIAASWVLLAGNEQLQSMLIWYAGDTIFLLACLSLSVHVVLIKQWAVEEPPALSAFYILACGSIILLPLLLLYGNLGSIAWDNSAFWYSLLYLTLFTTLATFLLQQYLLQTLGANHLLAFTYLVPAVVLLPSLLSSPQHLWYSLPGILLTILALFLIAGAGAAATNAAET
ncbi:MAG: DMT family transporter [Pseudomonadales bacterium]|nr:DMT family transporter [Pseudomonadales bacterium]